MSGMGAVWRQLLGTVIGGACVFSTNCVTAQITPDRTLPNNSSITINGSTFNITGGTQAGRNLFHSFQQFSVPTGGTASFNNGLDIQNIFSRVTGGSPSNIDGIIKANGTANLFFLNPNGIVFGKNASLNVGGSFVASTASSIKFADGFEYGVTAPGTPPLLTISVPSGLQFGTNPGEIQVIGDGQGLRSTTDLIDTTAGLHVQPNQTLALVGGDITLEGGTLKTAGGRIELGSVAGNSLVSLTPINIGFSLGYGGVQNFGNIQLSKRAAVDASGEGGGDIQVWGKNLTLTDSSEIEASTLGAKPGGSLVVNAQNSVQLIGTSSDGQSPSGLFAKVYPSATGLGGDLTINTGQLVVQDGAQVGAGTFGAGNSGNLTVTADSIQLTGGGLFAQANPDSTGDAGNLTIKTGSLSVKDNSRVSVNTQGGGNAGNLTIEAKNVSVSQSQVTASTLSTGNAGNLTVDATDAVELSGEIPGTGGQPGSPGGLFAQVDLNGVGHGGNLTINTKLLNVSDGSKVQAATLGQGDAGNLFIHATDVNVFETDKPGFFTAEINAGNSLGPRTVTPPKGNGGNLTIETERLSVRGGGEVTVGTFGNGNAGTLQIHASERVEVVGTSVNGQRHSRVSAEVGTQGVGNGGALEIETGQLSIRDGGIVLVRSQGLGNAGNLTVNARSIRLDNNGTLNADTQSVNTDPNQQQATITLRSGDLILRRNSNITANARGNNVVGGNINIDTDVLAALDNSNIRANSTDFRGGQVRINAQGIFLSSDSKITASGLNSQLNGTVQINTPDIDPSRGLIKLPTKVVDASNGLVFSRCAAFNELAGGSNFTITGRGGLPPSPYQPLTSDVVWTDTRLPTTTQHQHKTHASLPKPQPIEIVPATGWVFNGKGEVTLISSAPNATTVNTPTSCPAR
ncbi:MAG: S-layer family protein [Stigonema ocellatum SAG 48.90 = DSM 106950]|nr:S-layer family protein [Stigonema ocellatum SAG 48.90 = DSM 106950]